jgi:hypothetical protein
MPVSGSPPALLLLAASVAVVALAQTAAGQLGSFSRHIRTERVLQQQKITLDSGTPEVCRE